MGSESSFASETVESTWLPDDGLIDGCVDGVTLVSIVGTVTGCRDGLTDGCGDVVVVGGIVGTKVGGRDGCTEG